MQYNTDMKKTPPKKPRTAPKKTAKKKNGKQSKFNVGIFAGFSVLMLAIGVLAFNYFKQPDAYAQAALPIQTFQTTYKGYNPGTSWMSWLTDAQRCSKSQTIYGAKPSVAGSYPTLIYLHGTTADSNSNKEGQRFIERAAAQGFHALAVTYDSNGSLNEKGLKRHAYCTFDQSRQGNAYAAICATAGSNCSSGVLLSGFSQGAAIAAIAKNYNQNVKAVWAIGLSAYIYPSYKIPSDAYPAPFGTRALPNDKLVINMGQSSNISKKNLIAEDLPSLKQLTGADCGTGLKCLQPNGSGYYVVSNGEIKDGVADHCYWQMVNKWTTGLSCTTAPTEFDPGFQPPSTTDWSMIRNLNWLRGQL